MMEHFIKQFAKKYTVEEKGRHCYVPINLIIIIIIIFV